MVFVAQMADWSRTIPKIEIPDDNKFKTKHKRKYPKPKMFT